MADLINARDLDFLLHDWLKVEELTAYPRFAEHDRATFDAVLETARQLAEDKFRPHNRAADLAEPRLVDGKVETHPDVGPAIQAFYEAGFGAAHHDAALGGMQLPWTVQQAAFAYFQAANISTAAYPFLTVAAANLIHAHGSDSQKIRYMAPMLEGRFQGTMVLSEPHAGSSLSDVRTTARAMPDGSYRLSGSKMWISGGSHELSENIVHLVLARIEGAPAGVRGLSLFIVPRYRLEPDGGIGADNDVILAGLNHKMGYRGTVNTALSFGDAGDCRGELIGEANKGLGYMFHMMNEARIGVGVGAAMLAYAGYQHSLEYARERPQGRHPGEKDPNAPQIMLIEHADIRRLLLKQKVVAEGGLALGLMAAQLVDRQRQDPEPNIRDESGLLLDILTPIIKSWISDHGLAANEAAIQILGGAGFTRDHPVEQFYRDNRLNPIHEGTNGIQAIDLLGRKVIMRDGAGLALLERRIWATIARAGGVPALTEDAVALGAALERLLTAASKIHGAMEQIGARRGLANASAFMEMAGLVIMAWVWLEQAVVAVDRLEAKPDAATRDFLEGKVHACRYMQRHELPAVKPLSELLENLDDTVHDMRAEWF
jgi:alkylation response protein AidB-like acyl-CoA dehydrogenase